MATLSAGRTTAQTARPGATVRRARHARAAPRAAAFVETPSYDVAEWTSTEVEAIAAAGVEKPDSFVKDFSKPMSIPQEGIDAAVEVMRTGRIFRYSSTRYVVYMWCTKKLLLAKPTPVANAEKEFAEMVGQKYAIAVNSCSSAIFVAMMCVGVKPGDQVITNGFTFTALPSCIMRIGAEPVLVEATEQYTMDLDDLEKKAQESDAKVLLLSHMRGKVCDMDRVVEICEKYGLTLVEDCAHGCGVMWKGRQLGYHAAVACYSTQSDKVINSGEGGFITTDVDDIAAQAIYYTGCYERRYNKHLVQPPEYLCEQYMLTKPNLSCRMTEVTAAMMRPLIRNLYSERKPRYNARYAMLCKVMAAMAGEHIFVPEQHEHVGNMGDHLNFTLRNVTPEQNAAFRDTVKELGITLGWFTSNVNARFHKNWEKYGTPVYDLPQTDNILEYSYDMKCPPDFDNEDYPHIAHCIAYAVNKAVGKC